MNLQVCKHILVVRFGVYDIVVGRTNTSLVATGYEAKQLFHQAIYTHAHCVFMQGAARETV